MRLSTLAQRRCLLAFLHCSNCTIEKASTEKHEHEQLLTLGFHLFCELLDALTDGFVRLVLLLRVHMRADDCDVDSAKLNPKRYASLVGSHALATLVEREWQLFSRQVPVLLLDCEADDDLARAAQMERAKRG